MRYLGLNLRDNLILENLKRDNNSVILEIGCGLGSIIDKIIKMSKEYSGLDMSSETIDYLKLIYKNRENIKFYSLNVCKKNTFLNKEFDIIISSDTLEHVSDPKEYFNFIKKHLAYNGNAIITFPNESERKHHGITWFNNEEQLINIINESGLKIVEFKESRETMWHKYIKKFLWDMPKSIIYKKRNKPQIFEDTKAFNIAKNNNTKTKILSFYAEMVTKIIELFPSYKYININKNITNKRLLIKIKNG